MASRAASRAHNGAGGPLRLALVFVGYLGATLIFFAGALPELGRGFPGGPVAAIDGWQHVWHVWWAERALASGANPFVMPLLFFPGGVNLALHPLNLSNGLLVAPLTALAGPVAGFNLALLAGFTLSGLGGYLLALRAGAQPAAAFVAGLLFSFSPFHVTKAYDGQLELVALQWLALYAWLLLISVEQRGWLAPTLAGLLLAVVGYTSLYYLVYAAIYSLLAAALWLPARDGRGLATYLARLAVVPLVALLALAPLLLNLGQALAEVTGGELSGPATAGDLLISRSANLVDFWLPSYLHPLWGPAVARLGPVLHPYVSAWNHALGYTALALAAIGCATAWGRAWRWLVIAVASMLLALGPVLVVGPLNTGIALPYQLLLLLPGMDIAQRPGHLVVLTTLALTPLAALGLSWLTGRFGPLAIAAALVLGAIELAPPRWPIQPFVVHPIYEQLAERPGALLVLPVEFDRSDVLRDQIVHGRPLVGGYLARTPPYPFATYAPGVRQLWQLSPDEARLADPAGASTAEALAGYGIGEVVVYWERIPPRKRAAARAALEQVLPGVAPRYADEELSVYNVPPGSGSAFAHFGPGWYPEEREGDRRWRWMGPRGELWLMNPGDQPTAISLRLQAESFGEPRQVALSLNGVPAGNWLVSAQPAAASIRLQLLLPPGASRLLLAAPASPDPAGRGPISVVLSDVQIRSEGP